MTISHMCHVIVSYCIYVGNMWLTSEAGDSVS